MWSPEEQKVIESPYWELLLEQTINTVTYLNEHYSNVLGDHMFRYVISGSPYRYVNIYHGNNELLLIGHECKNPYGVTNKVTRLYSNKSTSDLALLIISKLEESKHEL